MTDQNVNTAGTDLTYAEAMAFARINYGIDTAAGCVQQDQWTKRYESAAGLVDIEMWGARQYRVKLVEPLTIKPTPVVVTMDELYADTDAASVIEQPAPTFDDLRAATDAANAVELAAHNALVQAENAYCYAAGLDGDDRREWAKVAARFGRTKAGQALHAALTEARQVLHAAVRLDTEACRKTWVNGFGTLNAPTEQPAPVCGTCGGEGDCMDCDTLTIEDAQEHVTELKAIYNRCRLSNWQENNPNRAALLCDQDDNIKALEAYIARRQQARADLNHILDRDPVAEAVKEAHQRLTDKSGGLIYIPPVDPSSLALDRMDYDWSGGYQDAVQRVPRNHGRNESYQAGYDAGLQDKNGAPDLTVTPDERPDIVTRLADVGRAMNSTRPTQTEYQVLAALIDSADAMISLRAQLAEANNIIGGLNADLRTCEKSRKATEEAWAGNDEAARAEIEQLTARANSMEWAHVVNAQRIAVEKSRALPHIYIASFVTSGAIYSDPYEVMAGSQLPQMLEKLSKYTAWAIAKDSTVIQTSTDRLTTH